MTDMIWENAASKTALLKVFLPVPLKGIPLETLSAGCGLDKAGCIKAIAQLNAEGLRIGFHETQGYYYDPRDNHLHPDLVAAQLPTRWWGSRIVVADEAASTIDLAKMLLNEGAGHGLVVLAERQTQGRGRGGNRWSGAGGKDILLSFFAEEPAWHPQPAMTSLYAATAVARTLDSAYQLPAEIKFPNDVYLYGKKAAGFLAERTASPAGYLISMGINVLSRTPDWVGEVRERAVSLCMAKPDEEWKRDTLVAQFGTVWETLWEEMKRDNGEAVRGYWKRYSNTLGKTVTLLHKGVERTGFAQTIDDEGKLLFTEADGTRHALSPEEVQAVRVIE